MQSKVDSFHGRIIKTFVLSIRCPTIVKRKKKAAKTKLKPLSIIIEKRSVKGLIK